MRTEAEPVPSGTETGGLADLASTTESILQEADELRKSLEAAASSLGQASARLRRQVDDLLAADRNGEVDDELNAEDGDEPSYPPQELRRFGLR